MKLNNEYWSVYRAAFRHKDLSEEEKQNILKLYESDGREAIYMAAKQKKIIPATAMLMCRLGIDKEYWGSITKKFRERNKKVVECLDEIYTILYTNGVRKIAVVENFGALLASGENLAMFGSGDVDNFADLSEKNKIYEVLKKEGYTIEEVRCGDLLVSTSIRKESVFPEGFYVGINWDITCRVNLPCLSSKGCIIEWDRCLNYRDTSIRIPSPEALMYICLMHIAVHGFCKAPDIRLYYDIANAETCQPDWTQIADWAKRDKNRVRIAVAANLANYLLEVPVPDYIQQWGTKRQIKNLISCVYIEKENQLKVNPGSIRSLCIEAYSDDQGFLHGLWKIVFPERMWVEKKYGSWISGNIKHIADML